MNLNTASRAASRPVVSTTDIIAHTDDTLVSQIHPASAANTDTAARMVNPLWMITVALAAFFGLGLLFLSG